ncbi:hypothetical protein [Streptomyces sp. sk2.1]|nr:hypothetical protein [Streptomyces sp. sk2.1]
MPDLPQHAAKPETPQQQLPKPAYRGLFLEPAIADPQPEPECDE